MAHSSGGWKFQGTDPDRFGVWWGLLSWCLCGISCSPLMGQKRPGRSRSLLKDTDEMPESVSLRTRSLSKDLSTKTIHWVLAFNVWVLEWQAVQTIEFCFSCSPFKKVAAFSLTFWTGHEGEVDIICVAHDSEKSWSLYHIRFEIGAPSHCDWHLMTSPTC